ncbi:MAG: Hsp70 family protein, partial [Candidatus Bathyarchaeota archaeon]
AESLIYTAEKTKKDLEDKIGKEQVEKIDEAIAELRKTLSDKNIEQIKAKNEELAKVLQEVGTAVYQQAAAKRAEEGKAEKVKGTKKSKEKVVDADYEEVKEDTKEQD